MRFSTSTNEDTGELTLNIRSGVIGATLRTAQFVKKTPEIRDSAWTLPSGKNAAADIYKMYENSNLGKRYNQEAGLNLANYAITSPTIEGSASPETLHSLAIKLCLALDNALLHKDQKYAIQAGLRLFQQAIAPDGKQFDKEFKAKTFVGSICSIYNTLSFKDRSKNFENLIALVEDTRSRTFCIRYGLTPPSFLVNMICAGKSLDDIHKIFDTLEQINRPKEEMRYIIQRFFKILDKSSYDSFDSYLTTRSYDFTSGTVPLPNEKMPQADLAILNSVANISRISPIDGVTVLRDLLNNEQASLPDLCKGNYRSFRINDTWIDDSSGHPCLVKDKITEEYLTSSQAEIDTLLSQLYKKSFFQGDKDKILNGIYNRFITGDFSREETIDSLKAILEEKSPTGALALAESLSHRKNLPRYSDLFDVIDHLAGNLPVADHVRVFKYFREIMQGNLRGKRITENGSYDPKETFEIVDIHLGKFFACDIDIKHYDHTFFSKPDLRISDTLSISPKTLHYIDTIVNFCTDPKKYSNVAVYISEMLTEAAVFNEDKTKQIEERLSFLSRLCQKEANSPVLQDMLPSIVDDVCLREKDAVIDRCKRKNNYSLSFYLQQSQQLDTYLTKDILKQIKGIAAHYKGVEKKQIEYNLVEFARKLEGVTVKNSLNHLEAIIKNRHRKVMFGKIFDEKKLAFNLAYEIAHPDSIVQVGPTCAPTSIEYYLCYNQPEKYLKLISNLWSELTYRDYGFDLTEVSEEEKQEGGLLSSELFQTIYYNRLFSESRRIKTESFGEGASLLLGKIGIDFEYNDNRHLTEYEGIDGIKKWKKNGIKMMQDLEQAVRAGKQVLIAYDKDLTHGLHAALITGYIEECGKIVAYKIYHGWDMGSKNGRTELITPKKLGNSIRESVTEKY